MNVANLQIEGLLMAVEMGIRHRESGRYEVVPVATAETFRAVWLPAAERRAVIVEAAAVLEKALAGA